MPADCPVCGSPVDVGEAEVHEIVECSTCGSELEVYSTDPTILEEVPEVQEDWGE